MPPSDKEVESIDAYIESFPEDVQKKLEELRRTIKAVAPEAEETISYRMPTFKLQGNLVHFAAFENHIGFYPTSSGIDAFEDELSEYKTGKGSVRFPLDEPVPYDLAVSEGAKPPFLASADRREGASREGIQRPHGSLARSPTGLLP